jgi:hypothetical protein
MQNAPMTPTNHRRGEISITLGTAPYSLVPSMQAVEAIEHRLDICLFQLIRTCADRQAIRMREMRVILEEGIRASGRDLPDDFDASVMATGIGSLMEPVSHYLRSLAGGNVEG